MLIGTVFTACGGEAGSGELASGGSEVGASSAADRPTVVVTTNILGEVVENLVGDEADVVTIMPVGSDPHDFQASAQQVAQIGDAELLVANGAGFEVGLLDVIESAEADGVPVFEAIDAVETLEFGADHADHGDDEGHADEGREDGGHADEGHADEGRKDGGHADEDHDDDREDGDHPDEDDAGEHADEDHSDDGEDHGADEHAEHGDVDPHFFTDPARMALAADAIAEFLVAEAGGIDVEGLEANAAAYVAELEAADAAAMATLESVPEAQRTLVTNHEVFGYFADRYGFEVVGTVIPSGTTVDGASAQELAELAELIEREGVPAIFADTSSSAELANTLAAEVAGVTNGDVDGGGVDGGDVDEGGVDGGGVDGGGVEVVQLFSESLGPADSGGETYIEMVATNAERIADALAG